MKSIFIIFCSFLFSLAYSQEDEIYTFYIQLDHYSNAPEFKRESGRLVYIGKNVEEGEFFSKYEILDFYQAFPASRRPRTLNVFSVSTYSGDLASQMMINFPSKYVFMEDITGIDIQLAISPPPEYTNDYGSDSPVTNNGVNASLDNFDYINVPKAWGYTKGSEDILIGLSDAKIDITDADFQYKTSFLPSYAATSLPTTPYSYSDLNSTHGTAVGSIAAAQGDNSHGVVGVCSNCKILMAAYNSNGYNGLLELAQEGVRVINMSWGSLSSSSTPVTFWQWVIDEIHEDYGIVMVAASGNTNPWASPYTGTLYNYPASYNHVISVSGVNHKNDWGEVTVNVPPYGDVSRNVKDMISPSIVTNYMGNGPYAFYATLTINDKVDICAPAFNYFRYAIWVGQGTIEYNDSGATSAATPHVTGTVGLMFSLNECLNPDEVEDILQLTSKNLENIVGNENWAGRIGSGKLETGDTIEFVDEMMQPTGNALIDGQDFYRFNFFLEHINNKLTISNQIFRDNCTADFTAKNVIDILPGSDFKPNTVGFVDLKINSNVDITCSPPPRMAMEGPNEKELKPTSESGATKLYPNPNKGTFDILPGTRFTKNVSVEVYDIYGKMVYSNSVGTASFQIDIPNLSTGMYIVKLSSDGYTETVKFVKE